MSQAEQVYRTKEPGMFFPPLCVGGWLLTAHRMKEKVLKTAEV